MSFFYKRSFHSFITHTNAKTMPFKDVNETRDPGGIGFADEEADSLMLCTEYLGFESYDMKMSDDELENKMTCHVEVENERVETKRRKMKENVVVTPPPQREQRRREFPPPLSSLNSRGQRSFYLRAVRKDGRLELTQVMIDRPPEIFTTSRENGRLRLHLVEACRDSHETAVELDDDEPKVLDPHLDENVSGSNLKSGKDINDEGNDQVVDLSMVMNDDSGVTNSHDDEVSLKSEDVDVAHFYDEHDDVSEWRYTSCCKIVNSNDNHHHHHHLHLHLHPYHHHHNSNNNMHLWSRSYVKTR